MEHLNSSRRRTVFIVLVVIGIASISIPWLFKYGFTWEAFNSICVNFGIGIIAGVLVSWLSKFVNTGLRKIDNIQEFIAILEDHFLPTSGKFIEDFKKDVEFINNLRIFGLEKVYTTRESAYAEIANEMKQAKTIYIASGSLYSFWSLYREIFLERDQDSNCDLKVALLKPDSVHAIVRASMDTACSINQEVFNIYIAVIKEIKKEIKFCRFFDMCPPASLWLIDDKLYVTPYFYNLRGGQSICLKIIPSTSGVFEKLKKSLEKLIECSK
jgi:hypothetical protein